MLVAILIVIFLVTVDRETNQAIEVVFKELCPCFVRKIEQSKHFVKIIVASKIIEVVSIVCLFVEVSSIL
jgi:hypothetical protein